VRRFWRHSTEPGRHEPDRPIASGHPSRRARRVMAAVVTAVAVVAFAVFGGLSYAKSGASAAASNVADSVTKLAKQDSSSAKAHKNGKDYGQKGKTGKDDDANADAAGKPGDDQYVEKVLICHAAPPDKPKQHITLKLSPSGAQAHLRNHPADYAGPCR
jgi:hypothetical protein